MRKRTRSRIEAFGYTLAFAGTGDIGFYSKEAAPLINAEAEQQEFEPFRLDTVPIGDSFRLSAPLIVWFEITRYCNLPCLHCYVEAGPKRTNELSTSEIYAILNQLKAKGVFSIVFCGGEPFAHPDFMSIVKYAHDLGFVISIATNGTYLSQSVIDEIPREECVVSVSLDGTESHKKMRHLSTYEETIEKLKLLKKNGIRSAVMTTLTNSNLAELEEIFEFTSQQDLFFGVTPFSPVGRGKRFPHLTPDGNVAQSASPLYFRNYLDRIEKMQSIGLCVQKFLSFSYKLSHAIQREFCGISLAYITSDGELYPCSVCMSAKKYSAGTLREASFAELWDTSFKDIRAVSFNDFKGCANCDIGNAKHACAGRCPVMSEIYTGDPLLCGASDFLKQANRSNGARIAAHRRSAETGDG
ncbi:radical SAM protein [Bradyrhizobium sp. B117]|uniref:radical SAM/SPASM domain-containing protein n=1 Tax=Bradyrhizobium sp. B117 TaxID=3140246 RepID=UPI003183D558